MNPTVTSFQFKSIESKPFIYNKKNDPFQFQFQFHTVMIILIITFFFFSFAASSPSSNNISADFYPLQSFKSSSDRAGLLSSWSPAADPCSGSWLGVSCHNNRVTRLVLENLTLNGSIQALTLLPLLAVLSLKNNNLSGSLHLLNLSLWQPHLKLLYLSNNRFRGPFPESVILLRHLHRLDLAGNCFAGKIPANIGNFLPRLLTLRLEDNLLSGEIPSSIGKIQGLADLNVSFNHLTGEIPAGKLSSFPLSSFTGNLGLCGKPLPKLACPKQEKRRRKKKSWIMLILFLIVIVVAAAAAMLAAAFLVLKKWRSRRRREEKEDINDECIVVKGKKKKRGDEERLVFFEGCREFVMEDLMRGSAEMLGRGAVGSTYRVSMEGEGGVVVKRVRKKERAGKEWVEAEGMIKEIGRWRHPNVVSLLAYYSSQDELLLVFQFAPKGSLHNLLHGNRGPGRTPLNWTARLKLALGAAKGLSFLHEASKSKLSHQHLTSSNILINEDDDALISDFALHQLLAPPPLNSLPQDITQKTNLKCDVYSFGVVLLEILTGRTEGEGEMDLTRWVQMVVREEWTSEVFDFELLRCKEVEDEMVALLQVALLCLTPDPKHRPKMSVVHKMIEDIKERGCRRGRGSLSPSVNDNNSYESSPGLSDDTATFTST